MEQEYKYMVRVSCMTYNHAPYIEDAMNGFTMQQTTFPFVCTIVDDASTDGEPEVIKRYLQEHFDLEDNTIVRNEETDDYVLTFARHKINHSCFFAVFYLKYNHYQIRKAKAPYWKEWANTKYIAICEGDDYWIDEKKLQKQVDFLEKNQEYGLVWSDVNRCLEVENKVELNYFSNSQRSIKNTNEDFIIHSWFIAPCTWVFRRTLYCHIPQLDVNRYFTGDTLLLLHISSLTGIHYMDETLSVYRVLPQSASHFSHYSEWYKFWWRNKNLRMYFGLKKNLSFRIELWKQIAFNEHPSVRRHPAYILKWFSDCIYNMRYLFFRTR